MESRRGTAEADNIRRSALTEHRKKIAMEYLRFSSERIRYVDSTWEEYLQGFRYKKELLQHLITGHKPLYDLYVKK